MAPQEQFEDSPEHSGESRQNQVASQFQYDDDYESSPAFAGELRATLAEHLEELRGRIFRIAGAILVGTTAGWFLFEPVYRYFDKIARSQIPKGVVYEPAFTNFTTMFFLQLKLSFYIGLMVVIPYAVWELWGFIRPGLKPHERRPLKTIVPLSTFLFFLGAFLAWAILPVTINWFFSFSSSFPGTRIMQDPELMIMFQAKMLVAFGAGFQLPLVVFFLTRIGIISPKTLMRYWRQSTIGVFIAAAVITPSGDIPTMLAMAVPLTILFFITILAANYKQKGKKDEDFLDDLD